VDGDGVAATVKTAWVTVGPVPGVWPFVGVVGAVTVVGTVNVVAVGATWTFTWIVFSWPPGGAIGSVPVPV
jgi:hypothetical protein